MEYLSGGNLKEYIQNNSVLTEQESYDVLATLLKMIEYLNNIGVMHRDLKPENIMLREGKIAPENLVLIDFGFSVFMSEAPFEFKRCGTPGFIAPEIFSLRKNEPMYGPKCDIFSIGIICYYCLFGSLPFNMNSSNDLLEKNKKLEFSFEKSVRFTKIENSLKRFLERDPNNRIDLKAALDSSFLFNIFWTDEDTEDTDGGFLSEKVEKLNK